MAPTTSDYSSSRGRLPETNKTKIVELEKDLSNIRKDLDECRDLRGQMDVLNERTQTILQKATKNENAISGSNGNKGMKERLTAVESSIDKVKEDVSSFKKVGYAVLIAVIGIFMELFVQLILAHGEIFVR